MAKEWSHLPVLEQTIASSPLIKKIFELDVPVTAASLTPAEPLNAPQNALPSGQAPAAQETQQSNATEDSMDIYKMDDFYADIASQLDETYPENPPKSPDVKEEPLDSQTNPSAVKAKRVIIVIRESSLICNGETLQLESPIRDATVVKWNPLGTSLFPQDALVLSLRCGFLVFVLPYLELARPVHSFQDISDEDVTSATVRFPITKLCSLHAARSPLITDVGREICVDRLSRSLVVSSYQDWLLIITRESPAKTSESPDPPLNSPKFPPSSSHLRTQSVRLDGQIVHCCFVDLLDSYASDQALLFVLYANSHNRLICALYQWATQGPLQLTEKASAPFPVAVGLPVHVVPCRVGGGLLLVMESSLLLLETAKLLANSRDFLSSAKCPLPSFVTSVYVPDSSVLRLEAGSLGDLGNQLGSPGEYDEVVISTEAGVIYSVLVSSTGVVRLFPLIRPARGPLGGALMLERLPGAATAFLLAFGGDGQTGRLLSVSGLFSAADSELFTDASGAVQEQLIPLYEFAVDDLLEEYEDWSPVADVAVVPKGGMSELWLGSGMGERGSVARLLTGVVARRKLKLLRLPLLQTVFPYTTERGESFLIVVAAEETLVYEITQDSSSGQLQIDQATSGLVEPAASVLIAEIPSIGACLQVTERQLCVADLRGVKLTQELDLEVTLAAFSCGQLFLVGYRPNDDGDLTAWMEFYEVRQGLQMEYHDVCDVIEKKSEFSLNDFQVSFVRVIELFGKTMIAAGFYNRCVMLLQVTPEKELKMVRFFTVTFWLVSAGLYRLFSAQSLYYRGELPLNDTFSFQTPDGKQYWLLGQRNGIMRILQIDLTTGSTPGGRTQSIQVQSCTVMTLGLSPVSFFAVPGMKHVLVKCDDVWRLDYDQNIGKGDRFMERVYFNDDKLDRPVSQLFPFTILGISCVGVVRNKSVYLMSLDKYPRAFTRKIRLGKTPKRLCYVDQLDILAVSVVPTWGLKAPAEHPAFCLIDISGGRNITQDQSALRSQLFDLFTKDEMIISLCHFPIAETGSPINETDTSTPREKQAYLLTGSVSTLNQASNRLSLLLLTSSPSGDSINASKVIQYKTDGPIFAIAKFNETSFAFSVGRKLLLASVDLKRKKFVILATEVLPSLIVSLAVSEKMVFVGTKRDSVKAFYPSVSKCTFLNRHSEDIPRRIIDIAHSNGLTVAGDQLGTIVGITSSGHFSDNFTLEAKFQYHTITLPRIRVGDFRPPWFKTKEEHAGYHVHIERSGEDPFLSMYPSNFTRFISVSVGGEVRLFTECERVNGDYRWVNEDEEEDEDEEDENENENEDNEEIQQGEQGESEEPEDQEVIITETTETLPNADVPMERNTVEPSDEAPSETPADPMFLQDPSWIRAIVSHRNILYTSDVTKDELSVERQWLL